ncbi:MAG: phosphotriesterase [Lachnospiraceae bacterium]|nr:phosphotriesterase [Lachnospiraceae bacterium]
MGKRITTVLGDIAPEQLGKTSMHEHVLMNGRVLHDGWRRSYHGPLPMDPETPMSIENVGFIAHNGMCTYDAVDLQDEELMMGEVADFKEAGANAMTECSAIGLRCNMEGVKRIAAANGVHIVPCTGFYAQESLPPRYLHLEVEDYYKVMMDEVKNGIEGTGIYPGFVKIAMNGFTQTEENTLRAAARVAKETGLSLTVHPSWKVGADAVKVVEVVIEEGADPTRLVIAHVGSSFVECDLRKLVTMPEKWGLNLDTVHRLLSFGTTVCSEFLGQSVADELNGFISTNDFQRLAGFYALIKEGYASQIVLGTDLCCKMLTRRYGGQGYLRLWNFVIPTMTQFLGISERVIRQIFVDNPARMLAW